MKKYFLMFAVPGILVSCNDSIEESTPVSKSEQLTEVFSENLSDGKKVSAYYKGDLVDLTLVNGSYIYEGDIVVPENQLSFVAPPERIDTEIVGRTSGRWPKNTVYYQVASDLPDKARVTDAIAHWESKTSLKFVNSKGSGDYILFQPGSGCSSSIGRIGGRQVINLADACSTGNNIHEIGHAVGIFHEQARSDRDNFVTINFQNIQANRKNNFSKATRGATEYTSTLDFESIMMYGSFAFSKNGKPTIVKKDGSTYTAQRNGLSSEDLKGIALMYPANGGGGGNPVYNNGQYYTIDGLRVYRFNDKWFHYTSDNEWREVVNRNGEWFYV